MIEIYDSLMKKGLEEGGTNKQKKHNVDIMDILTRVHPQQQ